jgi:hypothetical protein
LFNLRALHAVEIIGRFLRIGCGSEDRALVALENLKP